ncbi:hypothetical protein BSR29_07090 [Boudabousia liubingyangii]|uniref:Uncharacterized protein n=2 Tax=Boudabousia liubingyangii TaxID=1921764 RepID=A0A1Q5PK31_9ACTO|nr:hypothetical protein BSR29_07090 [Boudabousia liubingyangii]
MILAGLVAMPLSACSASWEQVEKSEKVIDQLAAQTPFIESYKHKRRGDGFNTGRQGMTTFKVKPETSAQELNDFFKKLGEEDSTRRSYHTFTIDLGDSKSISFQYNEIPPNEESWQAVLGLKRTFDRVHIRFETQSFGFEIQDENSIERTQKVIDWVKVNPSIEFSSFENSSNSTSGFVYAGSGSKKAETVPNLQVIDDLKIYQEVIPGVPSFVDFSYAFNKKTPDEQVRFFTFGTEDLLVNGQPLAPRISTPSPTAEPVRRYPANDLRKAKEIGIKYWNTVPTALVAQQCQHVAQAFFAASRSSQDYVCGSVYHLVANNRWGRYFWNLEDGKLAELYYVEPGKVTQGLNNRLPLHDPLSFGEQRVPDDVPGAADQDKPFEDMPTEEK